MNNKKKSYLKRSINELLEEMDNYGGGINVKISQQELIGLLPNLHNSILTQGISDQEHQKGNKYLLLAQNKQQNAMKKKFKYQEVLNSNEELVKNLLDEKYFSDWFLQGFNLNFVFFGRAVNIHKLAIAIFKKYEVASQNFRVQTVRFTPRSNDNFYTENIEDLFSLREITKIEESGYFFGQQSISFLENLSQKEYLETKIKKIQTEVVRITFINGNQQSELNLINLYDDLFIHSSYQTKYEVAFEKAFINLINECKAIKYLSNQDNLSRLTIQKTRLLEYLQKTVFASTKNIIVADYSTINQPSSCLQKYENLLMRLMYIDKFNEINTVCHRYSSKSYEQTSDYQSDYNTVTHRYSTYNEFQYNFLSIINIFYSNIKDDSQEDYFDNQTRRKFNNSFENHNRSFQNHERNIQNSQQRIQTPNQQILKITKNYDLPVQQQFESKNQKQYNEIDEGQTQKKTFKQEMKELLNRINSSGSNEQLKQNEINEDLNICEKENKLKQTQTKQDYIENKHFTQPNNFNKKGNLQNQTSDSIQENYESDKDRLKTFQTQMSCDYLNYELGNSQKSQETKSKLVSKKYQNLQYQSTIQHKQLLEECYQQKIEELNLQIQESQARYEIEINELREIMKNQSKKITLLAAEKNVHELVTIYEAQIYRYVEQQKKLREQINYLTDIKIQKDNQKNLSAVQKQNIKFKEMIASLNLEFSEREEELAKLQRERRKIESDQFILEKKDKRIKDLESQRDQLLSKNDELMNSMQQLNQIIQNLKQENTSLNKCVSTLTLQNQELSEDNQTLQQILSLQSKESTQKIVNRKASQTNIQLKNQVKSNQFRENPMQKHAFSAIEKSINTLNRLVLKTGTGIPEEIISNFEEELKYEWQKILKEIEYYKQNNQIVTDFLTNFISSLEQVYGKNDKNVRDFNKFIRNFLLEQLNDPEERENQFKQNLQQL
ncbi:hypothetical protein ABPG74_013774 [Tetrahymena malaccensis]